MNDDWFDELTNGEPLLCSIIQMSIIETLLRIHPMSETNKSFIISNLDYYTDKEADNMIRNLKENVIDTDPRDQWKKMFN